MPNAGLCQGVRPKQSMDRKDTTVPSLPQTHSATPGSPVPPTHKISWSHLSRPVFLDTQL